MVKFLKDSESFAGLTFDGFYNMPLDDFEGLYHHYKKTGENLLDDYTRVKHLMWDFEEIEYTKMISDEFHKSMQSISKMRSVRYFDPDGLRILREKVRQAHKNYKEWSHYNSNKSVKRRKANSYTSKQSIRDYVFDIHGKTCLCCGSKKNIQLDHIRPVSKGGKNEIDNLQPLCKSCNVKKNNKTIDYR